MRSVAVPIILLTVLSPTACADKLPRHRNIVFILIDDLRYDTFGFMNHPFVETPNIDALANKGVQFTNAFVTTSLCSPSRASYLTGQYMHNHKVVDNADHMPEDTQTFPQLLQKADYKTAFIGKWHMGGSSDAKQPGFDHWVSFRGQGTYAPEKKTLNVNGRQVPRTKYMTDELTDYSMEWINDRNGDQPFLLYLSHKGVHGLYDPAPRHRDHYQDAVVTAPATMANTAENYTGKPMWVHDQRNSWHGVEFPYHGRANQSLTEMYRHYCEMILSIDDSVGRLMQTLRDKGFDQETMIVFTSDGGHLWGEHGLIDKRCAYEESIRIPLLASCPVLIPANSKCSAVVANIDIAPTFLELAGVSPAAWMDGRSLVPLLRNPASGESDPTTLLYEYYWEPSFPQTPTTFSVRGSRYKFIQYHGLWDTDELYDITTDPQETKNLINDPAQQQRVAQQRRQLYERLKATNGLAIPLGSKRNHGSSQRSPGGSKRAEFPPSTIHEK
jgi:N-acetylglucosamine-6-sulfatase